MATTEAPLDLMYEGLFLFMLFSFAIQLITLQDVAPYIGWLVLIAILLVLIFVIARLIQYWTNQAEEEYAREHPEYVRPPDPEDQRKIFGSVISREGHAQRPGIYFFCQTRLVLSIVFTAFSKPLNPLE